MIRKKISSLDFVFTVLLALGALVSEASANGGPVDGSNIYRVGRIKLINQPDVQIVREELNIKISGDLSRVRTSYVLRNKNKYSEQKVRYGFPVDFCATEFDTSFYPQWHADRVKDFKIYLDDKLLQSRQHQDVEVRSVHFDSLEGNRNQVPFRRAWFLADFSIPQLNEVTLQVEYTVVNHYTDYIYSKSYFMKVDKRYFRYDLSPARFWGDSVLAQMEINIDASDIISNFGSVKITGIEGFNEKKGVYSLLQHKFRLDSSSAINVEYDNSVMVHSREVLKSRVPKDSIRAINASSSLKGNYQPTNLVDADFGTAWVEGGTGVGEGEWVEFEFKPVGIGAIVIVNGYYKSAQAFEENGNVARLVVEIESKGYGKDQNFVTKRDTVKLSKGSFGPLTDMNFWEFSQIAINLGDMAPPTRLIRLTILEGNKGEKYDDICISEVFFCGSVQE